MSKGSEDYRHFDEQDEPEVSGHENHSEDDDDRNSRTPTERYAQRKREADSVWFSGFFSGASYVPKPVKIVENELSEDAVEELRTKRTYVVPRGYTYYPETLPDMVNPAPQGGLKTGLIVYMVLAFISFALLLVASCPIPWYKGKNVTIDGVNYKGRWYTLYVQKKGAAGLPQVSLRALRTCPQEKQFFQSIAASTVMATLFVLFSLIAGAIKLSGGSNYGWVVLFGFLGFAWAVTGNAMSISNYYLSRCEKPRFSNMARLDAGFALSCVAWVLQMVAVIVLVFATRLNFGPSLKAVRVMDTWFLVLVTVALLFTVIGNVSTNWKRRFNDGTVRVVRVTYWHTEVILDNGVNLIYGRAHYRCSAYNKRIKASVSFLILTSVALFLTAVLGVLAFSRRLFRILACVMGIISSVFLLISWVIAVVVKYRHLCSEPIEGSLYANYPGIPSGIHNGDLTFKTYGLAEGVALPIVAWVLCTLAWVLNFIVPWPAINPFGTSH